MFSQASKLRQYAEGRRDFTMRGAPPVIRRLLLCACAAVGFAAMVAVLHRAVPLPVAEVTPKLKYLEAHRRDFDTVFIGSSRIYHGVSPKVFDAAMAAAGKPTRSFNLAVAGLMPPESLYMTRTMLAMRPPRLRTVFLEVASAEPIPDMNNLTERDIYTQDASSLIHGLKRAQLDLRVTPQEFRWQQVSDDLSYSVLTFAQNELNVGRLASASDLAVDPEKYGPLTLGPDRDGYVPARNPLSKRSRRKLEMELESIRKGIAKERPKDDLNEEDYAHTRDLLEAHGVELILVTAPVALRDYHARVDLPPGVRFLAFDDPDRHPELFEPEHRSDSDHLNNSGARIFSQELADSYLTQK
jgi:hypothetical protein